jgi:hypothetical protein
MREAEAAYTRQATVIERLEKKVSKVTNPSYTGGGEGVRGGKSGKGGAAVAEAKAKANANANAKAQAQAATAGPHFTSPEKSRESVVAHSTLSTGTLTGTGTGPGPGGDGGEIGLGSSSSSCSRASTKPGVLVMGTDMGSRTLDGGVAHAARVDLRPGGDGRQRLLLNYVEAFVGILSTNAQSLRGLEAQDTLMLAGCGLLDDDMIKVLDRLRHVSLVHVSALDFRGNSITDVGADYITTWLLALKGSDFARGHGDKVSSSGSSVYCHFASSVPLPLQPPVLIPVPTPISPHSDSLSCTHPYRVRIAGLWVVDCAGCSSHRPPR